ncbi:hypothetical protein [Phaeobacter italicus]|jgi:hypothetical protein|uniref:hypothetical protein n=1 Tax=Phaeobacter italicus TaxID=481446 RepID=UPI002FDE75F5
MTIDQLKQALDILSDYVPNGNLTGNIYGYHDEVQVYPDAYVIVNDRDAKKLKDPGWMRVDEDDEEDNGWMFFT